MEKKKAHYDLNAIKTIVAQRGIACFTLTAVRGVENMDLSDAEAIAVISDLNGSMFYKSMTTHADHKIWQDVYYAPCPNGKIAYIKFTMQDGAVVIQFKER
jgi:motility quorum-sensing regulator/GCU-specific mRNA interferase toxin